MDNPQSAPAAQAAQAAQASKSTGETGKGSSAVGTPPTDNLPQSQASTSTGATQGPTTDPPQLPAQP